jgi:hypothetical protein
MIEFDEAVKVAGEQVTKFVNNAKDITLEGVLISEDSKLYEVTFSYELTKLNTHSASNLTTLQTLASLMSTRREYKVFLVDTRTGKFRGFKNYKEQ